MYNLDFIMIVMTDRKPIICHQNTDFVLVSKFGVLFWSSRIPACKSYET